MHGIVAEKDRRKEDKPTKDVEVEDGEELVHRVAADKEGNIFVVGVNQRINDLLLLSEMMSSIKPFLNCSST